LLERQTSPGKKYKTQVTRRWRKPKRSRVATERLAPRRTTSSSTRTMVRRFLFIVGAVAAADGSGRVRLRGN